jgi:enamine deaminase RidA (YjgF/YER057c/UK114 family)
VFDDPAGVPTPPPGRYSHLCRLPLGDSSTLLLVSGQVALDDDLAVVAPGDMRAQSERIFELLGTILGAHGATFEDVVNIRTYLTDIGRLDEYAEVRLKHLPSDQPPTSTTVEVSALFRPGAVVEVEVMAVVDGPAGRSS